MLKDTDLDSTLRGDLRCSGIDEELVPLVSLMIQNGAEMRGAIEWGLLLRMWISVEGIMNVALVAPWLLASTASLDLIENGLDGLDAHWVDVRNRLDRWRDIVAELAKKQAGKTAPRTSESRKTRKKVKH
jgi:hypothetical protein